jgi:hypothetical protein
MSKLIFFNIPATGHVNPAQAVITELVRRGHHVIYFNAEETRAQVEQTGAEFRPYPSDDALLALNERAAGGNMSENALALVGIAEVLMPAVLAALTTEKPDAVIHDSLAGWGKQAAEKLGIRAAAFLVTFAINLRAMPALPPRVLLRIIADNLSRTPAYNRIARRTQQKFGVRGYGLPAALMNTNALNIVFTSRQFQPAGETFDESYRFVGPSITERPDTTGFPLDALTRKPLIYISLGTINNQNLDFYKACFAAFADDAGQVVLSAGKNTDLRLLEPIPAHFTVRNFVPQLDVLQRADVFITHGGMNSVHEGLWYGVPLVVVPQQFEQAMVARQVVANGAGVMPVDVGGTLTADGLRTAVETINSDRTRYREAVQKMGESFRAAGGYVRAADEIEAFVRKP